MVSGPCHEPSNTPPKLNLVSKATWANVPPLMRLVDRRVEGRVLANLGKMSNGEHLPCRTLRPGGPCPRQQPTPAV